LPARQGWLGSFEIDLRKESAMSDARKVVEKHYEGASNHDLTAANSVHADDVDGYVPGVGSIAGAEAFDQFSRPFFDAFPDASMYPANWVEAGDTVVVEGSFRGTHTGVLHSPAGDVPPTGKSLDLKFCDIFRVKDGKVVAHHIYFDRLDFAEQLGLAPPPPQG
jgi:predicted ester cyclase